MSGVDITGSLFGEPEENIVGRIDDAPMLVTDYDFHVANYLNFTRPQRASGQLTAQDTVDALNYAWDILIRRELENKKANEFGLIISDNEIRGIS